MADKEDAGITEDDVGGDGGAPKKAGGIAALLPGLLKWIAIGGNHFDCYRGCGDGQYYGE